MIIKVEPNPNGSHANQGITPRIIPEGWIKVPPHLEVVFKGTGSFCDLIIENDVLVDIIPLPVPEPEPVPPEIDPLTETQLAMAELAQVVEDNNTATQLAIVELAGIILGG